MRDIRNVKKDIGSYLDETRPKRQRAVSYFAFFLIMLFASFLYGRTTVAEDISATGVMKSDIVSGNTLNDNHNSSLCPLPKVFPAGEYQNSWDKVLSYCDIIESSAANWGFDPQLIASIIMIESGGDPSAISQSGAIGIMQIMSSDGLSKQLFGDYFSSRPTVVELLDPKFNIEWGTSFLASLLKTYGNDIREALLHYGPANVGYEGYADKVLNVYKSIAD